MEILLAIVAVASLAGLLFTTRNVAALIGKVQDSLSKGASVGSTGPERADETSRSSSPSIIFPDYVDEDLLDEVAQQLGINVEAVGLTLGAASRRSLESGVSAESSVNAGVASAGTSISESEGQEKESSASMSFQRRPNFRAKIRAVLDELEARQELVSDLKQIPDTVIPEATFLQAGLVISLEWDLLGVSPGNGTDDDVRPEIVAHLDELEEQAKEQIQQAVRRRYRNVGQERRSRLALVTSRWHVHVENSQPALGIAELDCGSLVPRAIPELDDIPAPSHEIWVPLSSDNLSTHGQQRMIEDHFVEASVFGRIDGFDRDRQALVVLPIAVYSEQGAVQASASHENI
jgi:hypothetical protein